MKKSKLTNREKLVQGNRLWKLMQLLRRKYVSGTFLAETSADIVNERTCRCQKFHR